MEQSLKIVYFAWVRERLGKDEETVTVTGESKVSDIVDMLKNRDAAYLGVFDDLTNLRFALDQDFVSTSASIGVARELAIFPPVTGG